MNNDFPLYYLFIKYLEGKCTPDEIRQLLLYFEDPEDEQVLRSLISAELGFTELDGYDSAQEDAAIAKVKSILLKKIQDRGSKPGRKKTTRWNIPAWTKIAAISFVLMMSLLLLFIKYFDGERAPGNLMPLQRASTLPGQRKLIQLYDGTKIWLSPSSSLEYRDQLTGNLREVKLEGEAFFEVAKDKKHPFVIHSERMDTRVVGTSFNIQSYKGQLRYSVTVVTGIVKVSGYTSARKNQNEVLLKPNQQSNLDLNKNTLQVMAYPNAAQMLKRRDGILNYDGAQVSEVIADFSRYYNIKIAIESKSRSCLCYGEFNTTRPVHIVLEQLAAAIGAKVIVQKDKMILKGGCEE